MIVRTSNDVSVPSSRVDEIWIDEFSSPDLADCPPDDQADPTPRGT